MCVYIYIYIYSRPTSKSIDGICSSGHSPRHA